MRKILFDNYPDLMEEWNWDLNKNLNPHLISFGSSKKAWWKCLKNENHIWETSISDRTRGRGCPFCAGQRVNITNCLLSTNPEIASQWHPTKNGDLTPLKVTNGSNKKVWWKCDKGEDHEWYIQVHKRTSGYNCPVCSGQKVVNSNCLATLEPDIASEWHPTKNGILTPFDFTRVSGKKVWWICSKDKNHEWQTSIAHRVNGRKCPYCQGKKVSTSNSLRTTHPALVLEWDFKKNINISPDTVSAGSDKYAFWKCKKGNDHKWKAKVVDRTSGNGCPVCAGRKVVNSNCLATMNPKIASEWHPTKNGTLTPYNVTMHTRKKVWWKCPCGDDHEWQSTIENRNKEGGRGCPICSNRIIINSNCLQTTHPKIASEFHKTKNGKLTSQNVGAGSNKKVWWQCRHKSAHEWKTIITSRTSNGSGCPYCSLTPQSKEELIILFELKEIFKEIEVENYKIKFGNRVYSFDIFIPTLNQIIEYDGGHWHKDNQQADKRKVEIAQSNNINIFRVRQKPLKKITNNDLVVNEKFDGKEYVDIILIKLIHEHQKNITLFQKKKIKNYFMTGKTKADKKLEKYIDSILKKSDLKIGKEKRQVTTNIVHLAESANNEDGSNK